MEIYDPPFGFGHLSSGNSSSYGGGTWTDKRDFESEAVAKPTSASFPQQTNDDGPSNKFESVSHEYGENARSDREGDQRPDEAQRRLAQNREAARKSRLRKKAYVQQLESSHLKLPQQEYELDRTRNQGIYRGSATDTDLFGFLRPINSSIMTFDMEYSHCAEEQRRKNRELWKAMHVQAGEMELRMLVCSRLKRYDRLFCMKMDAAKVGVLYIMSGTWRSSAEQFFLWIGGFRPSEQLNLLMPQIEPMSDQQLLDVYNLRQSYQQEVAADLISGGGNYRAQIAAAMERLEAWENFVNQADHLRQQTMQRMARILTTHQAARVLLGLGDYFDRRRAS